jgi:large subunit ribosomal protein L19
VEKIQKELIGDKKFHFSVGDTIEVSSRIVEGDKERVQMFRGIVIQIHGKVNNKTFTVRKISEGVGVEKIFPLYSPAIKKIKVVKQGKVRRARLFYLRGLTGKKASNIKMDQNQDIVAADQQAAQK